jgi:hypothetical protein
MARLYYAGASHTAAGVVTEVSTLTTLNTMLQVATPATTSIKLCGWGVSFKGVSSADPPGMCYLMDCDTGMSAATSLTPDGYNALGKAVASLCVGGTGATCVSDGAVTEGTIANSQLIDAQEVHPQAGYAMWWPEASRPEINLSRFVRLRVSFSVAISALPWIVWDE